MFDDDDDDDNGCLTMMKVMMMTMTVVDFSPDIFGSKFHTQNFFSPPSMFLRTLSPCISYILHMRISMSMFF